MEQNIIVKTETMHLFYCTSGDAAGPMLFVSLSTPLQQLERATSLDESQRRPLHNAFVWFARDNASICRLGDHDGALHRSWLRSF